VETDPQIEELKELVRRNIALAEDTNRILHGMRNASRWSTAFRAVWWLVIAGVTIAAYSYLWPYISQILSLYSKLGASGVFNNLGH
jgi:hypothetical protein